MKLLRDIKDQWDLTEETLKVAEQTVGAAVFPAIKELRYAGRRLADALPLLADPARRDECHTLLVDARFDCYRARHDAIDAATESMLSRLDLALTELGADVVDKFFPEAFTLAATLTEIRQKISVSRKNREDRDLVYQSIEKVHLPGMLETFSKFIYSRQRMMKHAMRSRAIALLRDVVLVLTLAIALIGLAMDLGRKSDAGGKSGPSARATPVHTALPK